jgi:hypothetical protein
MRRAYKSIVITTSDIRCRCEIMRVQNEDKDWGNVETGRKRRIEIRTTRTEGLILCASIATGCCTLSWTWLRLYILYTKCALLSFFLFLFLSPRCPPTAMFHGIPPWERRVNKHLSFLAREATGRLKCLNLGARARPPPSFCPFFLSAPSSRGQRDGRLPEGRRAATNYED